MLEPWRVVSIADAHASLDWVDDYLGSVRTVCIAAIESFSEQTARATPSKEMRAAFHDGVARNMAGQCDDVDVIRAILAAMTMRGST